MLNLIIAHAKVLEVNTTAETNNRRGCTGQGCMTFSIGRSLEQGMKHCGAGLRVLGTKCIEIT